MLKVPENWFDWEYLWHALKLLGDESNSSEFSTVCKVDCLSATFESAFAECVYKLPCCLYPYDC